VGYGALIGLAVLTRLEFILAVPFPMLALPRRNRRLAASIGRMAFVLGGFLLAVGPWVIRNALVYRRVLLSNSLGQVLSGGLQRPNLLGSRGDGRLGRPEDRIRERD
jgi:hypothetical protein